MSKSGDRFIGPAVQATEKELEELLKQAPEVHQAAVAAEQKPLDVVAVEHRDLFAMEGPALHSAYLVAVFKLTGTPAVPVFVGVGIFSEPEPSVGGDRRCWTVFQIDDTSYAEAQRHLLIAVRSAPHLAWAVPHLKERDL